MDKIQKRKKKNKQIKKHAPKIQHTRTIFDNNFYDI